MARLRRANPSRLFTVLSALATLCCVCGAPAAAAAQPAAQKSERAGRAAGVLAEGVAAFERGDVAAARGLFERALALDPRSFEAHTYLGVIADGAGDLRGAEKHFAAAAARSPLSPQARNNYGAILMRLGRAAQAAAQFEASLKINPRQPSALVNLGRLRSEGASAADLRAARELFERARAIAPDAEIARALTVVALRQADAPAARTFYQEYVTLSADPRSPAPASAERVRLAAALLEAKLADEAVSELAPVVAAEPANVEAVVKLSEAYMARKETAAAGRTLEAAVARGVEAAPVYAALAEIYVRAGRVENAIPAMRLAIGRDPANEAYRFRYALLLVDTQAPKAAVIRVEESLREFPRSARLWFALGLAHLAAHQNEEAERALARALELDPRATPALAYLGLTHAEQGRHREAEGFYERALARDERAAPAHYMLADLLLKQTDANLERAERHLLRSIELDAQFASARLALAKLYARQGRFAEAAAQLERAVQIDPNLAEAHYQLGRAYQRLRRADEAQVALATFKRLSDEQKGRAQDERRDLVRRLANVRF